MYAPSTSGSSDSESLCSDSSIEEDEEEENSHAILSQDVEKMVSEYEQRAQAKFTSMGPIKERNQHPTNKMDSDLSLPMCTRWLKLLIHAADGAPCNNDDLCSWFTQECNDILREMIQRVYTIVEYLHGMHVRLVDVLIAIDTINFPWDRTADIPFLLEGISPWRGESANDFERHQNECTGFFPAYPISIRPFLSRTFSDSKVREIISKVDWINENRLNGSICPAISDFHQSVDCPFDFNFFMGLIKGCSISWGIDAMNELYHWFCTICVFRLKLRFEKEIKRVSPRLQNKECFRFVLFDQKGELRVGKVVRVNSDGSIQIHCYGNSKMKVFRGNQELRHIPWRPGFKFGSKLIFSNEPPFGYTPELLTIGKIEAKATFAKLCEDQFVPLEAVNTF